MTTRILGIDPSLTATGVAMLDLPPTDDGLPKWTVATLNTKLRGHERIEGVLQAMRGILAALPRGALVVVESPAVHGVSANFHQLVGFWWLLRHELYKEVQLARGGRVIEVNPKSRARYLTENGNATKLDVLAAARREFAPTIAADDNQADAMVLAAMGARHLGRPVDLVGPKGTESFNTVRWES